MPRVKPKPLPGGAVLSRVMAGAYELRTASGTVFTIESGYDERERLRWFVKPGPFPGGRVATRLKTLEEAVDFLTNSED